MTHVRGRYVEDVEERIEAHFQGNPSTLLKGEPLATFILDLYAHDQTVIEAAETIIAIAAEGGEAARFLSLGEEEKRADAQRDEKRRNKLDALRQQTDCPASALCTELGFKDVCAVKPVGTTHFLGCDEGATCHLALAWGTRYYCRCPLRICIKEELCLYAVSDNDPRELDVILF